MVSRPRIRRLSQWWLAGLLLLLWGCRAGPGTLPDTPGALPEDNLPTATSTPRQHLGEPTPAATLPPSPSPSPTASPSPSPTPIPDITLAFTGNIVPARCVQAAVDERGGDPTYLYARVAPLLQQADLAIGGGLAATLSDYPPPTGCRATFVLVGRAHHAAALAQAGLDVIAVATNHIKDCGLLDCGDRAFLDTLANLRAAGIQPVGAGANLEEALEPVIVDLKGVRFAFISHGELRPRNFAGPNTPGTAPLTEENVRESIRRARAAGAQVIVALPHWGPEYEFTPTYPQRNWARILVQAGADLVVGNHPHVVQGMEVLQGVPVFYSLGSFLFDQTWSVETRQSVLLLVRFRGPRLVAWRFIPVAYNEVGEIALLEGEDAQAVLDRIWEASPPPLPPTPPWPAPTGAAGDG